MYKNYFTACKDCEKRVLGCHSYCEDYQSQKTSYEKDKQKITEQKQKESMSVGFVVDRVNKIKRRKNREL